MNADDPTNGAWPESLNDADPDEIALTRAVLRALRGWMMDGQSVVITRDTVTHEIRIETFDVLVDEPALAIDHLGGFDESGEADREAFASPGTFTARGCPARGVSITASRARRRLHDRKR